MTAVDLPSWPDGPSRQDDAFIEPVAATPKRLRGNGWEVAFAAIVGSSAIHRLGDQPAGWLGFVLGIILFMACYIVASRHVPKHGWSWPQWIIAVTIGLVLG